MKKKLSLFIADYLADYGISHVFTVTGGGAMHLNDAFGHHPDLKCIYNHHEQASAIAAEGYARLSGKTALTCVTSGPGGTNAITGVLGAWLDSIPMLVISGQVKLATTVHATDVALRQLGDQEYDIVKSVSPMTKYAVMVENPDDIKYHLEKALYLSENGRKGPVWLDIPLDVQAAVIETDDLRGFNRSECESENPVYDKSFSSRIVNIISAAKRPAILAGTGIRLGCAEKEFLQLADKLKIPVLSAWNAHDVIANSNPYFCGKPGTIGTRAGNFTVSNCDVLLVLGCRLNIRQISYNSLDFAKNAFKIVVDIDGNELKKPTIHADLPICADVKDVIEDLLKIPYTVNPEHQKWLNFSKKLENKYNPVLPHYFDTDSPVNPYVFIKEFFNKLTTDDAVITGNGSACVITFQAADIKQGQRVFTNSGCAAMGYGFPAAIGCSVFRGAKRTICIDGDGSFQMNLQELQTVIYNNLNLKIVYINNHGYHSIRQTQTNLFSPPLVGVSDENGISFPDMSKLIPAYGIQYFTADSISELPNIIERFLNSKAAAFLEVLVDPSQNFEPKLSSKVLPDGKIVSPAIYDMYPFLPEDEINSNLICR